MKKLVNQPSSPNKDYGIKERFSKESNMVLGHKSWSMVTVMWVNSRMVTFMVRVLTNGKMEVPTKANFSKEKGKEKESGKAQTVIFLKANTTMT